MRRLLLTSMLVTGGLLAVSCTSDREPLPTQAPNFLQTTPLVNYGQVAELIAKLFPAGPLRQEAYDRLSAIQSALVHGDVPTGQALAIGPGGLVAFAVRQFAAGTLQQVKGVSPAPFVVDLINAIYRFVGMAAPIPESAKGSDGKIAVVGRDGGDVVTDSRHAEINIPAGALNEDVLVTIGRLPDTPAPLPTDLDQFPLFYDFATFPDVPKFNTQVTVALCVVDQDLPFDLLSRLRLAHPRRPDRTTIEILALASQEGYPSLFCGDLPGGGGGGGGGGTPGLVARLASAAFDVFAPPPLYGAATVRPGGLGGQTDNLSSFGGVDPGKLVFTTQPTNTAAGGTITPPVQVTVERQNGSTIRSFSGTISAALGANPGEGTLSGTTTVTPVNGVATFANLSINNVGTGYTLVTSATSALGQPPASATSALFDIVAAAPVQIDVNNFVIDLSAGRIVDPSGVFGSGSFKGTQVIFGAGFAYGSAPENTLVGYDIRGAQSDFVASQVTVVSSAPTHHTTAQLQPRSGLVALSNVTVTQESFAFTDAGNTDYVLLKYTLSNHGSVETVGAFAGFVADEDLDFSGTGGDDIVAFNPSLNVAEVTERNTEAFPEVIGIAPIAAGFEAALNYEAHANPGGDPLNSAGYFPLLSGGLPEGSPSVGPGDVRHVIGFGPFSIPAGGSRVVWFALVGGDNSSAFAANVTAARAKAAALSSSLLQLPCSLEPTLHSITGLVSTFIGFVNQTTGPVTVYWLDYLGQRVFYNSLAPGQSYDQQTYLTHPWVVTDATGACLGIWLPSEAPGTAVIGR